MRSSTWARTSRTARGGTPSRVAAANGVQIDKVLLWRYRHCLTLADETLRSPPRVTDAGGAGHEAFYLLAQLVRRPGGASAMMLRQWLSSLVSENVGTVIDA